MSADPRGRLKPCMDCGKGTSASTSLCSDCTTYEVIDPLVTLVNALKPKYPLPQPELPDDFRPACSKNPDIFFSERTDDRIAAQYMCASGCPLKEWCVDFATQNKQKGVWGGTTGADRRKIRSERARQAA